MVFKLYFVCFLVKFGHCIGIHQFSIALINV